MSLRRSHSCRPACFRLLTAGALAGSALVAGRVPSAAGQAARHPLDALTAKEYWAVYDVLRAAGRTDTATRFAGITLREPPKPEVLAWKPGTPFRREAVVVVRQGRRTYEAVVDIAGRKLAGWTELKGVQPNLTETETKGVEDIVKQSPEWRAAMARRGLSDMAMVRCYGAVLGNFGTPEERGRRLVRATCSDRFGVWDANDRGIEGVVVLVDLDEGKVLRVIDTGVVPIPRGSVDHDPEAVGQTREVPSPILVTQPQGPGFVVEGHEVAWQNWRFHFRVDPRQGVIVSTVRYQDGERVRSVLYQGSLAEIFVPYMDPTPSWYFVTFLDVGENPWWFPSPLERGADCPDYAAYFDGVAVNDRGVPQRISRAACLFEREPGDIAWRHYSEDERATESRARRDHVLRTIGTLGNYDYLVDWVFMQDGGIKVVGAATGIVNTKAVPGPLAAAPGRDGAQGSGGPGAAAGADEAYGRYVAEHTVAVNHDHFLSFRLDLDVDGPANTFMVDRLAVQRLPAGEPRRSIWTMQSEAVRSEQGGQLDASMEHPALWRVVNPTAHGPFGRPTGYQIRPGHSDVSILTADDNPQVRGGFSRHQLWVTRQNDGERLASGVYTTGSRTAGGLPVWAQANRPLENADLVVWYTMGIHHVARTEDWPVMPMVSHEVELRPFDFFTRNPALDLPRRP
jgi:primary-amine oxidase